MITKLEKLKIENLLLKNFKGKAVTRKNLKFWLAEQQEERMISADITSEELYFLAHLAGINITDIKKGYFNNFEKPKFVENPKTLKYATDAELKKMYVTDLLSLHAIAKKYNSTACDVKKRLEKMNIKIRNVNESAALRHMKNNHDPKGKVRIELNKLLIEHKTNCNRLSKEINVDMYYLYSLQNNKANLIRLDIIEKICEYFKCQVGELLRYNEGAC